MGLSTMIRSKVNIKVLINGVEANALLDTGSSLSHLSYEFSKMLKLNLDKSRLVLAWSLMDMPQKELVNVLPM